MNFTIATIKAAFITVCSFKPSYDPTFPSLSSNLTTGNSGIIINDGYIPYLTLENIKDLGVNFNDFLFDEYNAATTYIIDNRIMYTYPDYVGATTYATGERVLYLGTGYESLTDANTGNTPTENYDKWSVLSGLFAVYDSLQNTNLNKQPDLQSAWWLEVDLFNAFLEDRIDSSVINVLNKCILNKNSILESKKIYYGIGDGSVTITNDAKYTGLKFDFIKNENIKLKINRIGLHFKGVETNLIFYVYNQNTEQTTFTASCTSDDFIWVDVSSVELSTDKSGSWFIYYKRSDISNEAINNEINLPKNLSNFVKINQFEFTAGTDLKTINENDYTLSQSNIANIDYSILVDISDWLVKNKLMFATAIKLQFGLDIYKMFLENENQRINKKERGIPIADIRASIFTSEAETVNKQLKNEIKELRDSIGKAKIDNISLPTKGFMLEYGSDL